MLSGIREDKELILKIYRQKLEALQAAQDWVGGGSKGTIHLCKNIIDDLEEFKIPDPELVGVKEAAAILGWDSRRVSTYRSRGTFPAPLVELAMGPIWTKEQIIEFQKGRRGQRVREFTSEEWRAGKNVVVLPEGLFTGYYIDINDRDVRVEGELVMDIDSDYLCYIVGRLQDDYDVLEKLEFEHYSIEYRE